jgi:hypothetical protein
MKKFLTLLSLLLFHLLSAPSARAQGGGVMFTGGVASSSMSDLKILQEHILSTYPVDGKVTSSFPPFTTASLTVFKQYFDYLRVGGGYTYSTTGGKSSYQDYSGELFTEMNATSHRLGVYLSYVILGGDLLDLSLGGRVEANYSTVYIQSRYNLYSFGNQYSNRYWSISPTGSIGPELMFNLNRISLGVDAGYLVDLRGELKDTTNGNTLKDPFDRDRVLSSDWTGWYTRISLVIRLKRL